mgnify:CR=1 FL=1
MYYATLCSGIIFIVLNFYLCIAMNGTILLIFIICQFLFMYVFILFCNFSIFYLMLVFLSFLLIYQQGFLFFFYFLRRVNTPSQKPLIGFCDGTNTVAKAVLLNVQDTLSDGKPCRRQYL